MKRFKLSPDAAADIREIWAYIAEDSVKAARKVRLSLFDACQLLAENPVIGFTKSLARSARCVRSGCVRLRKCRR